MRIKGKPIPFMSMHIMACETEPVIALAVRRSRVDIVNMLLRAGANPSLELADGTLLQIALTYKSFPVALALIEHGANVHQTTKYNEQTPLSMAVRSGAADVVQALLDKGADADGV